METNNSNISHTLIYQKKINKIHINIRYIFNDNIRNTDIKNKKMRINKKDINKNYCKSHTLHVS